MFVCHACCLTNYLCCSCIYLNCLTTLLIILFNFIRFILYLELFLWTLLQLLLLLLQISLIIVIIIIVFFLFFFFNNSSILHFKQLDAHRFILKLFSKLLLLLLLLSPLLSWASRCTRLFLISCCWKTTWNCACSGTTRFRLLLLVLLLLVLLLLLLKKMSAT